MKNKTKKQKYCGAGKSAFLIPQFIFNSSCAQHDAAYIMGGGIIEKVMADTFFYAHMLKDISKGGHTFIKRMFYFKMATLYFITVSIFGMFFFNWKVDFINWKVYFLKRRIK